MYNWTVKRGICHEQAPITWTDVNIGANTIKYPWNYIKRKKFPLEMCFRLLLRVLGKFKIQVQELSMLEKILKVIFCLKGFLLMVELISYRGLVKFNHNCKNPYTHIKCDGLICRRSVREPCFSL